MDDNVVVVASAKNRNSSGGGGGGGDQNDSHGRITASMATRRRNVLTALLTAATAAGGGTFAGIVHPKTQTSSSSFVNNSNRSTRIYTTLTTVPDMVQWIDENCDRRFLAAVVASDYHFLYRGIDDDQAAATVRSETPDLLLPETYSSSSTTTTTTPQQAAQYFQALEKHVFRQDDPIQPSLGHLATTSVADAAVWGVTAASIWPTGSSSSKVMHRVPSGDQTTAVAATTTTTTPHYAWLQQGGTFDPSLPLPDRSQLIVDGKDCGRDNLEDALRMPATEIMFTAESFLAVPVCMDQALRRSLQKSFLL